LLGKRVSSGPNPLLKDSRKDFELIWVESEDENRSQNKIKFVHSQLPCF
jgi:hypothetical protein